MAHACHLQYLLDAGQDPGGLSCFFTYILGNRPLRHVQTIITLGVGIFMTCNVQIIIVFDVQVAVGVSYWHFMIHLISRYIYAEF